jgi:hypothetical protein
VAWRVSYKAPGELADDAAWLDRIEQDLLETVVRDAARKHRALLTSSGPLWTVRSFPPGSVAPSDFEEAATGAVWKRGTRLPSDSGPVWLMCRMSGLSIPMLAQVEGPLDSPRREFLVGREPR